MTLKTTLWLAIIALAALPGCTPPGPAALLSGDELLRANQPAEAVVKLHRATELLPQDPRAWNLLGVAYHRSGQPRLAEQAYRQALTRDRSNAVTVAHYNLGCLLLEQNNAPAAASELLSYTLLAKNAPGLAKLGAAQTRLKRLDLAEPTYLSALRLDPKNTEALNGLGVICAQRNQRDAAQSRFNAALAVDGNYGPALLNSALVAQQNSATKPVALQRCRAYLAAHANAPQAEIVKTMARQLEAELAPAGPSGAALAALNAAKSNALLAALAATNTRPQIVAAKTNAPAPVIKSNLVAVAPVAPVVPTKVPVTIVAVTNDEPPKIATVETPRPPAVAQPPAVAPRAPTQVVSQVVSLVNVSPAIGATPTVEEKKKPGFFTRLNPFSGKPAPANNASTRATGPREIILNASTTDASAAPAARPAFPRYTYSAPARPTSGNRLNAERALQQATAALRAGRTNEAMIDYQSAIASDPSCFDAQYGAALLAFQTGDLKRALAGWETALTLEADSLNTRYSFALALKQGNFPYDAAGELERVLEAKPSDTRAHLVLGNLYSQQLGDLPKARAHYQKVLELDPRNAQSAAIRFWLAANP